MQQCFLQVLFSLIRVNRILNEVLDLRHFVALLKIVFRRGKTIILQINFIIFRKKWKPK